MSRRIRKHIRSNIIGYIALFFALSTGSAVALSGSNTVFTDDIANDTFTSPTQGQGGLVAADLRPGSVGTSEATDNSLTGTDINESTLALGGQLAGYFEAVSATGACNDDEEAGTVCASTGITLARSGQLSLNASGQWVTHVLNDPTGPSAGTDDTTRVLGNCVLRVDGSSIGAGASMGERSSTVSSAGSELKTCAHSGPRSFRGPLALGRDAGT
jgi:hypothetical protein